MIWLRVRARRLRSKRTNGRRGERFSPSWTRALRPLQSQCRLSGLPNKGPSTAHRLRQVATLSCCLLNLGLRVQTPRHLAAFNHVLEHLPVSQGIHGPPEALIFVSHEVVSSDQTLERLQDKFLALLDEIEYLLSENEKSPIDPDFGFLA